MSTLKDRSFVTNRENFLDVLMDFNETSDCKNEVVISHDPLNSSFRLFDKGLSKEERLEKMRYFQNLTKKTRKND